MNSRTTIRSAQVRAAYTPQAVINWGRDGVLARTSRRGDRRAWPCPLRIMTIVALGVVSWGALIAALVSSGLF